MHFILINLRDQFYYKDSFRVYARIRIYVSTLVTREKERESESVRERESATERGKEGNRRE